MAKKKKKTARLKSETTLKSRVTVLSHSKVVFTWPLLILGILFMILHPLGGGEEWMTWTYCATLIFVLLTLTLDLNRDVVLILALFSFPMFIIWVLVWYFMDINFVWDPLAWLGRFDAPYPTATFATISAAIIGMWVVDFTNSYLNQRYAFENGEMFRLKWRKRSSEFRLEKVTVDIITDDWLEAFLWGGHILIVDRESGVRLEIRNVWNHRSVLKRIRHHLPSDRSDRSS